MQSNQKDCNYVSHIFTPLTLVPLKCPFPLPPARTWAFKTISFVFKSAASLAASSGVLATPNLGVGTPASLSKL